MELRDYIRMLRRGWPTVVLLAALVVGLASVYLVLTPKRYEASTALFLSANEPQTVSDLQVGSQFSRNAVASYAKVLDSPAVLGPVAAELRPQRDAAEIGGMVTAGAPESTTLIEVVVAGDDPDDVTTVANAVAATAARILPTLDSGPDGRALVRLQQTRPAVKPLAPVSPNTKQVLVLGFIVGLCLGLATTITYQSLDTRLRQVDDLRELTDLTLVAVLPQQSRSQRHALTVRDDPAGAVGEAYRTLRTNLRFLEPKDRRSVLFTAVSEDREGAQVPANLAWSLVQAGYRVLLVDLDLRRTTVGDAFGMRGGTGLADVLMGQADLPEVVRDTTNPNLQVVTAGTPQASPADLLSAPMMTNVLRRMEQAHDYVILHAPPLLSSTDAALVSNAAGGTLLTVAAGRTKAQDLTTALGVLTNVRVTPLGLVLTGVRGSDRSGRSSVRATARPVVTTATPVAGTALNGAVTLSAPPNGVGTNGSGRNGSAHAGAVPGVAPTAGQAGSPVRHRPARPRPTPPAVRPDRPDDHRPN